MAFDTLQVKAVEGLLSFKNNKFESCYCLPVTDRVIRIKFTRSCIRSTLPVLNPKTLHAFHLSS